MMKWRFKPDANEKIAIHNLKQYGIIASIVHHYEYWYSVDNPDIFKINILQNNKKHSVYYACLNAKDKELILSLQKTFPIWFKDHFRAIEKDLINSSTTMLFVDYTNNKDFSACSLWTYLWRILPSKNEILLDATNFASLFGNETILTSSEKYTYFKGNRSFYFDSIYKDTIYLINKQTFIIADPSKITKTKINSFQIIDFFCDFLDQLKTNLNKTLIKLKNSLKINKKDIFNKNIKPIFKKVHIILQFMFKVLEIYTNTLPNELKQEFIKCLDTNVKELLTSDWTENYVELKDFIDLKSWNDFILKLTNHLN